MAIPIIDIFAGPGGLGEGFSALTDTMRNRVFKIALSIEKESEAHQTLRLRSFFRQFAIGDVPEDYYSFIRAEITLEDLKRNWPTEWKAAESEAWLATLGENAERSVDSRIEEALDGIKDWLLIGGPPCQAYSVVGRSRRKETILDEAKDHRVGLYKQYLRILAIHNPAVFVMENVKGLLSAETEKSPVFNKILNDLSDPVTAYQTDFQKNVHLKCPGYKIYSLVSRPESFELDGKPVFKANQFVIKAEDYGIPQTRHRVILLGIRNDIEFSPGILTKTTEVPISTVLAGLPRLRSGLSKVEDNAETWQATIKSISKGSYLDGTDGKLKKVISKQLKRITNPHKEKGREFILCDPSNIGYQRDWYYDRRIRGVCNHCSRSHMEEDLLRYFFLSCYAKVYKCSPTLHDLPVNLLPDHENVSDGIKDKKFADRFRVQLSNKPAKTITSHISKDGHYYVHYDPTQCRSFTVREAARIQTFPDNYFFCGPRTSQFIQVGNAVPPLLAFKIAQIVHDIFEKLPHHEGSYELKRIFKPLDILHPSL